MNFSFISFLRGIRSILVILQVLRLFLPSNPVHPLPKGDKNERGVLFITPSQLRAWLASHFLSAYDAHSSMWSLCKGLHRTLAQTVQCLLDSWLPYCAVLLMWRCFPSFSYAQVSSECICVTLFLWCGGKVIPTPAHRKWFSTKLRKNSSIISSFRTAKQCTKQRRNSKCKKFEAFPCSRGILGIAQAYPLSSLDLMSFLCLQWFA